jgi:hypothetical protein
MQMLAEAENMIMSAGQPLAPTEGRDIEHTTVHLNYTKSADFQLLLRLRSNNCSNSTLWARTRPTQPPLAVPDN